MVRAAALVIALLLFPVVSAGRSSRAEVGGPDDAPSRGSSYRSKGIESDPRREDLRAPSPRTGGLTAASQPAGGKKNVGGSTRNLAAAAAAALQLEAKAEAGATSDDVLSLLTANEYKPVERAPWPRLAEPFRETTLVATSSEGDPSSDLFFFTVWDGDGDAGGTVLQGREVKFTFKHLGRQRVTISQIVTSTGNVNHLDTDVMVKYVRREIRQLTDDDREVFFHAVETLYRLPTSRGRILYGNDYKGIEFFVQMHLDGAGVKDCDHWHDDAGIMTHHVGYTLLFEQMLQLVDPMVTVPYWEYTIEESLGYSWYGESEVFATDWFGDANPENALHTMDRGRFAFLPILESATDYIHNAYGLLRTPWNLDSTPFVTRHNVTNNSAQTSMVSCTEYRLCFDSPDLATLNNCLNGGTHGPVHILIGGEWNNPEEEFAQKTSYPELVPLVTKYLWRKGYLRLPEVCTRKDDGAGDASTCRASCPAELYESRGMTPYDVLVDVKALFWVTRFTGGVIKYMSEEDRFVVAGHEDDPKFEEVFWKKMLHSFCDPGHVGDLFTSSAPYDPLFWVIHPTAERFMNWRRMIAREYPDRFPLLEKWGYAHEHIVGETGTICDWSDVREGSLDMPTCIKGICGGHKAEDTLPFKINIKGEMRMMTNIEWLDFIYPTNEELPYVYNEYRWDHCSDPMWTLPHG